MFRIYLRKKELEPQSKNFHSKHQLPIKTADKYSTRSETYRHFSKLCVRLTICNSLNHFLNLSYL